MTSTDNMGHLAQINAIADSDTAVLRKKESTYQGSWKAAGGRSAWFMFRRNMDRLLKMMKPPEYATDFSLPDLDDCIQQAQMEDTGDCTLDVSLVKYLRDSYVAEDIFAQIELQPSGVDGTVLACLRDLRRYALLIEAEMAAQGVVFPEETEEEWHRETDGLLVDLGRHFHTHQEVLTQQADAQIAEHGEGSPPPVKKVYGSDGTLLYTGHMYTYQGSPTSPQIIGELRSIRENGTLEVHMGDLGNILTTPECLSTPLLTIQKATPKDGSQHENLTPWAVSTAWRHRKGFPPEGRNPGDAAFDTWWHQQARGVYVMEAAVPMCAGVPPGIIGHLYTTAGNYRVVLIDRCPPGARDWFPTLRREVNSTERDGLPEWQRGMYEWHENGTKWIIAPQYEAWVTGG